MKLPDFDKIELPDMKDLNMDSLGLDGSTTSLIVMVVIGLIVFSFFRKLIKMFFLVAIVFALIYLFG